MMVGFKMSFKAEKYSISIFKIIFNYLESDDKIKLDHLSMNLTWLEFILPLSLDELSRDVSLLALPVAGGILQ